MTQHDVAAESAAAGESRDAARLLPGGGEMGARLRASAWGGRVPTWPQSLRAALSICLGSRFPIVIYWGEELLTFYNDAYAPILASKHPWALGRPCSEVWAEIWDVIGPQLEGVLRTGEATWSDDQLLVLHRQGYPEECYFSFSFSPIRDERGAVGGVFTAVTENTERVLSQRRLQTLRDLAARSAEAKSVEEACRITAEILGRNTADIPFSLLYLLDDARRTSSLVGASGLEPGAPGAPETVAIEDDDPSVAWPFATAVRSRQLIEMRGVANRVPDLPGGPWPDSPEMAVMVPIATAGQDSPAALLIAGISSRRPLDTDYRAFFELIAGHAANAIAHADAYDAERRRAEALAELDRAKTAFFNNVSHEFRTPLTLMLGPLDEMRRDPAARASAPMRKRLELIHRNTVRLQKLVNTLLDFSRIESGRIEPSYEATDLPVLTTQLASMFESAVRRAGLGLCIDCPRSTAPAYVDREMWEKVVMNLLSNAFKFTLHGEIGVSLRETPDAFTLVVRDTGVGIPADEMPRLFDRFHRIRHAQARTHEGTGIGLALVHELVRLHGGDISARSEPGRGTEFTVRIPRGDAPVAVPPRPPGERRRAPTTIGAAPFVDEALRWLPESGERADALSWGGDFAGAQSPPVVPCIGARILIADDNADMRDYLRGILGQYWTVEVAADGLDALRTAQQQTPELVVSDVMMPGLDGFELLRALRADDRTRAVPVILLSARAGEVAAAEALEAGADAYLVKPFSVRELVAYVGGHLQLQRLRRQAQAALAASEAKFAAAFEQSPLALTITDLDEGRLLEVNEGFLRLSGYTRDEVLGRTVDELHLWVEPERRAEGLARLRAGERISETEMRLRSKNGDERIGMIGAALIELDGRPHILSSVVDVTERRRAAEQLAAANASLKEADRRKDEFLAMLGHELRNPLAAVRNAVATALRDPTRFDRALGIAARQADQLGRLIDDLLDVARITHGRISLRTEPVYLADVLERAIENTRPVIDSRGVRLSVAPIPKVRVQVDPARLEQVFVNVLSNAGKYTDAGGSISVVAEQGGGTVTVRIRDTGIGIAPQMLSEIWDLFQQADRSLDRSQGGLGIGLTVVRRLIELHGGRVEAHSDGLGKGAEFVVVLPALAAAAASAGPTAFVAPSPRLDLRVLLVEDNRDAAESLAMLLELLGYRVVTVYDGAAALDAAQVDVPDVMLVDIGLPGMNGYEVARRVRGNPRLNEVLLVALTGYGRDEDKLTALAAGFDHHLVKPVSPDALRGIVAAARAGA